MLNLRHALYYHYILCYLVDGPQVAEPATLNHYDYVADPIVTTPAPEKDDEKKSEGSAAPKKEDKPPIGVTLK